MLPNLADHRESLHQAQVLAQGPTLPGLRIELGRIADLEIALWNVCERQSGDSGLRGVPGIQHVTALRIAEHQLGTFNRTAHRNASRPIRGYSDVARYADRLPAGDVHGRASLIVVNG